MPKDQKLTPREIRATEIREANPSISWADLGRELDCDRTLARRACLNGEKKLLLKSGARSLSVRLDRSCAKYMAQMGQVTDDGLSESAGVIAAKILWHLEHNPEAFARSSGKDLTTMFGTLIDKRQLLRGEPTQITRLQDVKKLDELAEMLSEEMQRRGKIIDVTPEKV